MDGGEDPSVKRKLLRNIKSKYVNEKIPSKRFLMMQGKSNKTYNKRSPLKYEIKMEPEPKPEPKSNNSFITNSLQNIKKLKKEYIRKGGDDLDFLEKLNKKQIQLEKELFDNLESDFIKSNSFIFDTDQSGSGKARESTEEQKEARRKYQAEWVKNKRKNLTEEQKEAQKKRKAESYRRMEEDWIKSLTEEKRIAYYKYKEAEDKKKNLTEEEKREARKKYQAEWVKNKRKNLTEEQKESARNKRKNLKIANILLKLQSGKRTGKRSDKRSGTSPVMQGTSSVMQGSGKIRSQYHGKQSKVMVKVPENVKKIALYSFKLKKLGFGGGLETGWKRAKQLATKESISIQDLRYMRAWFARHIYTSYPTYKKWAKAGRPKTKEWHRKHGIISWLIWSGDAGFKWVNSQKNINLLNKHYNKNYKRLKLK
jgi:hypothetical protein